MIHLCKIFMEENKGVKLQKFISYPEELTINDEGV